MDDKMIVELYFERSEAAIEETRKKYGKYCHKIAYNILFSDPDAEECVNDTYLRAWFAMPPQRPNRLSAFLAKITRNLALDRYFAAKAQKRALYAETPLDELSECLPDETQGDPADEIVLRDALNEFLASLPAQTRIIFMRRYFYFCSVKEIAAGLSLTESNVKVILHRTREGLRQYLSTKGILI